MFVCKCLTAPQIITVFYEITMSFRHLGNSWREPQIETMINSRTVTNSQRFYAPFWLLHAMPF